MMVTGNNTVPLLRIADPSFNIGGQLDTHLLIHLRKSQISFAIYNTISNNVVAFGSYGLTTLDLYHEAVSILKADEWTNQHFSKVSLVVQPDDFVLVPKDLFDPREIATYLNFHSFKEVGGSMLFDRMEPLGIVGAYHLSYFGLEAIKKMYANLAIFASQTPFIQLAVKEYQNQKGDNLLIWFDYKLMHLMVTSQGRLVYFNGFEVEAKDDISYYSLAVCEQLSLSPEKTNLVVWGGAENFEERLSTLKYYFQNVQLGERPLALKFSAGLSALPVFSEYPLFASVLCE